MDIPTIKVVIGLIEQRIEELKEKLSKTTNIFDRMIIDAKIVEQQSTQIALSQALIELLKFNITVKSN